MKSQITSIEKYDVNNGFNDVTTCFYIIAGAIQGESEEEMSEDDLNDLLQNGDVTALFNSSRNISPFRTVLFPNDVRVMELFTKIVDTANKAIEKKQKPKFPIINLNRFEQEAPEPYFRRLTKDDETTGDKAGQWVIAGKDDETIEGDPMNRKLFRTIWVTSICKTNAEGKDIPTENVVRKALRAWNNGLEAEAGNGYMLNPAAKQLAKEARKAAAKKAKENDQQGGDEALAAELKPKKRRSFDEDETDD